MTAPQFPATLPDGAIGLPEDADEPEIDFTPAGANKAPCIRYVIDVGTGSCTPSSKRPNI